MMKKQLQSKTTAGFLAFCTFAGVLGGTTAFASLYDDAAEKVRTAEAGLTQNNIDAAQALVAGLEDSTEKNQLEKRLDRLQAKADAVLFVDYSDNKIGDEIWITGGWNVTAAADPDDSSNTVARQKYSSQSAGGWGPCYTPASAVTGEIAIETRIRFEGATADDRYFSLYMTRTADNAGIRVFDIYGPENGARGVHLDYCDGNNVNWALMPGSAEIEADKWYDVKVIMNTETSAYEASITDIKDNRIIGSVTGKTLVTGDFSSGIKDIKYRLSGSSTADNCYMYYDDIAITQITPLIKARNAVVKAERSKADHDVENAQSYIDLLYDGEDKLALQRRLNKLLSDTLVFENLKLEKEQDDHSVKGISVLSPGRITASISGINYNTESSAAQMILALYDENKLLVNCISGDQVTIDYGKPETLCATIDIPDSLNENYQLNIMIWNGLNEMIPYYSKTITSRRDPYLQTQAEEYDSKSGAVRVIDCSEGGGALGTIETGDYVVYNNAIFADGANSFEARISGVTTNGKIEIRLDSPTGALAGTIDGINTTDWDNYETKKCSLTGADGTHDIYLVFTEGINLNWFKFSKDAAPAAPYYGAKFEPEGDQIYSGAGQGDFVALMGMTNTANQNKKPIMLAVYNWILDGCTEEIYNAHANFPGAKLQIGTALMTNNYNGSVELAQGKYDDRIRKYANQLKALPHDIFMRIGYEADGPWNGYDPEQFKLAFRRIVDIFREEHADNVAFVWNISYPTLSVYDGMRYYPGDEYVDWWSYDFWVENPHSNAPADFINKAAEHGKPVLVGESSKQYVQFGNEFWDKYFSLINSYPSLKGFQYINWYWNTYGTSDWQWGDARFTTDQKSVERYNKEMSNSRYIGLDSSYFNTSGLAIQFGHAHEFLNNQSSLFNMPWNKQEDNYTLNNGYDYTVENAVYSPIILHGQHSIRPADINDHLSITFTVPDGRDGMIYFNDLNHQPKDAYIGQRQILAGSTESGKFNYYASDVINGTVTLKLKNTGAESMMIDYLMLQRISDDAPEAPTGLTVTQNANEASLAWEPIDGADYYNIYRNGRIIGVSTTPSYTDTDNAEAASYAVTSYDLKQGESLMSDRR